MKINKIIKDKQNKYKMIIDDKEYILYDDVILKYNLLLVHDIDEETLKNIMLLNDEMSSYYLSLKYIEHHLRSENEVKFYLTKKNIDTSTINKTIKRLKDNKYINDELYLKAYINDALNLSVSGPKKIRNNLVKAGIDAELIDEYLGNIEESVWDSRIEDYIDKKINLNHSSSRNKLKLKLIQDLISQGYDKERILNVLDSKTIDDDEILKHEYFKIKNSLKNKYEGNELEYKIKEKLYRKGFNINNIKGDWYED